MALTGFALAFAAIAYLLFSASQPVGQPQDRELPAATLADNQPLRITILGTSLTRRAIWPDRIADRLSACNQRNIEITRIAKAGANSGWGVAETDTVAESAPHIVLIEFAINDADIRDGLWLSASRDAHREIVAAIRNGAPQVAVGLMTTNPTHGLRGVMRPRLEAYYRSYRDLAEELGIGLYDGWPRWQSQPETAIPDGLHPDADVEAGLYVPTLTTFIADALGWDC